MLRFAILCLALGATSAFYLDTPNTRIINGTLAHTGEFPSIVSLQSSHRHFCAGSIIDATHILTAAHCTVNKIPSAVSIQYGVTDIRDTKNIINVKHMVQHEDYVPGNGYLNDVSVLTLEEPIVFSETAKPSVFPEPFSGTPENAPAVLAGWGYTSGWGPGSLDLQRVDIKVFSDVECETANESANRDYHVCAGVNGGGKGQCSGDSGGPLYVNGAQVGVVSWSRKPCTSPGFPGVFAKVTNFVDWINEQLD